MKHKLKLFEKTKFYIYTPATLFPLSVTLKASWKKGCFANNSVAVIQDNLGLTDKNKR